MKASLKGTLAERGFRKNCHVNAKNTISKMVAVVAIKKIR
jgi:hypothetical protein